MRIRWYALAAAALIAAGFAALLLLIPPVQAPQNDTVAINDLRHRLTQDFERVRAEGSVALPGADAADTLAYSVFDTDGRLLASTDDGLAHDLNEAIAHGDTIVDIAVDSRVIGKLVIDNTAAASLNSHRARLQLAFAVMLALLALVLTVLLVRVHRSVLRPFRALESFASNIAAGRLDIPLSMDRKNAFGAFTESFDLMRTELAAAREGERRANQSKKELAAQLSHDIKSPVASIKAISELMQVTETDARSRERAATIEAKADQIDLLISNMFHATLEELQELKVAPAEVASDTVATLVARADYRCLVIGSGAGGGAGGGAGSHGGTGGGGVGGDGASGTARGTPGPTVSLPPCIVIADPIRLEQVLDNVIGNSYKYADTPIAFEAEILDGYLWLAFTDTGPGVASDELPLLTQKFYRGTNAAEKSGSGLGLYIAHYFMERMEGTLTCENTTPGLRTRLALRLA